MGTSQAVIPSQICWMQMLIRDTADSALKGRLCVVPVRRPGLPLCVAVERGGRAGVELERKLISWPLFFFFLMRSVIAQATAESHQCWPAADVRQNPAGGNHLWSSCGLEGSVKNHLSGLARRTHFHISNTSMFPVSTYFVFAGVYF